jgi:hypothetical protein
MQSFPDCLFDRSVQFEGTSGRTTLLPDNPCCGTWRVNRRILDDPTLRNFFRFSTHQPSEGCHVRTKGLKSVCLACKALSYPE